MRCKVGVGESSTEEGSAFDRGRRNLSRRFRYRNWKLEELLHTSDFVSCMAFSTLGKVVPNSFATCSPALATKPFIASKAPTFVLHFPSSKMSSSTLNTTLVASGGNNFKIALVALAEAWRTTSPLSM